MNLLKSLVKISSVILLSRILGFIRDTMIARTFGAGILTDAFFIAFRLPNLLRRIFAEGGFYQIFLPILSRYRNCYSETEIKIFISHVSGLLIIILSIIVIVGLLFAPWIVTAIAPGFNVSTEKFLVTVSMFRIMFPYILLISLTSLMGAILNVWNFFLAPSFIPIFLNISMISTMLIWNYLNFYPTIIGLAWSVLIGGLLQCIYCFPFLKKINMLVLPKFYMHDKKIYEVYQFMGPVLISASSNQLSLVLNSISASFLQDGSISWIYYADRLIELPIGVFGVALNTILLPCLSRAIAISSKDNKNYCDLMNWGIKLCYILGLPSAIMLGFLAKPLIIALFQYGKFSEFDVLMTQYSVIAYSIGLPGMILVKILISSFYALQNTKTPFYVIMITVIFVQCINLICVGWLHHVTFAVSLSLGAWLNAGLLYWQLKQKHLIQLSSNWLFFYYQLTVSLCVMSIVCFGLLMLFSDWNIGNIFYRLSKVLIISFISLSSYFVMLWCLGLRFKDFIYFERLHYYKK